MKPLRFYLLVGMIALCDLFSKWQVTQTIPYNMSRPVLGRFLALTPTKNTGGAFSLLPAQNTFFIVVAAVAIVALVYAYQKHQRRELLVSAALALALGGAIGNLVDRITLGYVRDFFDVHFWPVFNVADSAITVGILMLAWHFLFQRAPGGMTEGEKGRRGEGETPAPEHPNT